MPETTYIVLRRDDEDGHQVGDILTWTVVGRSNAKSATAAIRDIASNVIEGKSGLFVATPERSWRPVNVKAEQTTVLRLEDEKT